MSALHVLAARKADLPPMQKRVLITLCETCNQAVECEVLLGHLSAIARAHALFPSTVFYAMQALKKRGYLQISKRQPSQSRLRRISDSKGLNMPVVSNLLLRTFPSCSLLKPHIHERT